MVSPKDTRGYNEYRPEKGDDFERSHKTTYVNLATLAAFDDLLTIASWEEFARVCKEQKRKRGW